MKQLFVTLLCAMLLLTGACSRQEPAPAPAAQRFKVVTTLFPLYDFARNIGGDLVEVSLLLPPGVEPHSFDPQPDDILRINRADLFVYTHPAMEPWAVRVASAIDTARVKIIDASAGAKLRQATAAYPQADDHDHRHDEAISYNFV